MLTDWYFYKSPLNRAWVTDTVYPDAAATDVSGGDLAADSNDHVHVDFDRLGRRVAVKDQRGVEHAYVYDDAGRLYQDRVTNCPSPVNDDILRLQYAYDDLGRPDTVSSYDDPNDGTVQNQVKYAYDPNAWGAVTRSWQAHGGAVNTETSPAVDYAYADGAVSNVAKYLRLTAVTYPGGATRRVINYGYPASGVGAVLSRLDSMRESAGSQHGNTAYTYVGANTVVGVTYPRFTETITPDRFGRVVQRAWNGGGFTHNDYTGYDRNSNRLWKEGHNQSEYYTYDGLDRLSDAQRGTLNGTRPNYTGIIGLTNRQGWTLESLGNWRQYLLDLNGDGDAIDANDLTQDRTHNAVNELTGISELSSPNQQVSWVDPNYDAAGNMTEGPKPTDPNQGIRHMYVYDAWNRLAGAWEDADDDHVRDSGEELAGFAYDGLHRRIAKVDKRGQSDITYDYYYNQNWQLLEVRKDGSGTPWRQYLWDDVQYIDKPSVVWMNDDSARFFVVDCSFNVIGLLSADPNEDWPETYTYDPYGRVNDGASQPSPSSENDILYAAYRYDVETGLYLARYRCVDTIAGRWISRDLAQYVDGHNLYEFVRSSPASRSDLDGLLSNGRCKAVLLDPDEGYYNSDYAHGIEWPIPVRHAFTEGRVRIKAKESSVEALAYASWRWYWIGGNTSAKPSVATYRAEVKVECDGNPAAGKCKARAKPDGDRDVKKHIAAEARIDRHCYGDRCELTATVHAAIDKGSVSVGVGVGVGVSSVSVGQDLSGDVWQDNKTLGYTYYREQYSFDISHIAA